ncbi:MAG: adenosylcobinamide-GDP ribazoletransferase [Clostridiales bacterium]|nr:adenosylcobinamide-GDP ribazoletransferase [Clostridiales bacterium]
MWNSLLIAFAMYSKIPVPQAEWTKENMRYVMCFFPWIGIFIGLLEVLAFWGMKQIGFGFLFSAVILTMIPILITGGIHMDGFMDTMDARSSWGDREKKLEILKDSHTGAFAILGCVVYFVLSMGAWSEMTESGIRVAACCFFFSRCLSGLAVMVFQGAKNSGLAAAFRDAAQKRTVRNVLLAELALCMLFMIWLDLRLGIAAAAAGFLVFAYYRWFSYRDFGGITGDLAGYFLQLCELVQILVLAVLTKLV